MITAAGALPAAIDSGIWLRRHKVALVSGFAFGLPSASRKFFPLTSTLYPIGKDVVHGFQSFESHNQARAPVHTLATKYQTNSEADVPAQLQKKTNSPTVPFKDDDVSDREMFSDALTLREEGNPKWLSSSAAQSKKEAKTLREERNPKRLSSSAAQSNKVDILQVIRYPLRTESAIKAILERNTLVFAVDKRADKKNIKDSFEKMLMIRAKKVNTLMMPDGTKKAYIMLPPHCKAVDVAKKIKIL